METVGEQRLIRGDRTWASGLFLIKNGTWFLGQKLSSALITPWSSQFLCSVKTSKWSLPGGKVHVCPIECHQQNPWCTIGADQYRQVCKCRRHTSGSLISGLLPTDNGFVRLPITQYQYDKTGQSDGNSTVPSAVFVLVIYCQHLSWHGALIFLSCKKKNWLHNLISFEYL